MTELRRIYRDAEVAGRQLAVAEAVVLAARDAATEAVTMHLDMEREWTYNNRIAVDRPETKKEI